MVQHTVYTTTIVNAKERVDNVTVYIRWHYCHHGALLGTRGTYIVCVYEPS